MSRLARSLSIFALLFAAVGCDSSLGSDPAVYVLRFGGRVVDGNTHLPLAGVTVKICNYEATGSTDGDGHWVIEIIPGISTGTYVTVTFERSGYGAIGTQIGVFPSGDATDGAIENRQFVDVGSMFMRQGEPLTVHVARDGTPLSGATVVAILDEVGYYEDGTDQCTDLNIVATTNTSGVATLPNLDPTRWYGVWVPAQDLDGDGTLDIFSNATSTNISEMGNVLAIATETYQPYDSPSIMGSNLSFYDTFFSPQTYTVNSGNFGFESVGFNSAVTTPNGSVQVVFRTPVEISGANFRYRNNLVDNAAPDFFQDLRINATATALTGSNSTIFNFVPASALPSNEVITLNFIARSLQDPTNSSNMSMDFYVPLNLGTIPFGIDNYNGSVDESGGANAIYLRFNEAVDGFYKILAYEVNGSTVTFENPFEFSFGYGGYDIINNQVAAPPTGTTPLAGAQAGKQFRARLYTPNYSNLFLNDNAVNINTVTIELSVRNIGGATLDGIFTVPVE
ncbi:MAG TPA: hypothetical protein VFY93_03120 [Planctomycetota bacterium]|nr:hypothetical protein [Planctomycetota bacterium]